MRLDIDAEVVDRGGDAAGWLSGLVFERESRRVAGFLALLDGTVPREVLVLPGQVAHVERRQIALALPKDELDSLPDAFEHLYVAPGQDVEEEVAAAEAVEPAEEPALVPDPDERPEPSAIPGFPLLPGYTTPLEVERSAVPESHIVLREGLRVIAADGDDLGHFGAAVIVNTRLAGLILRGDEDLFVAYEWLDRLDDDAGELTLTVGRAELSPFEEGGAGEDEEA